MTPEKMTPRMQAVNYYGCVQCQQNHFEDTEGEIYRAHLMRQDKHGIKEFHETFEERKQRYDCATC